jgi:hypothetical protein
MNNGYTVIAGLSGGRRYFFYLRESLENPKSRPATEAKAEFAEVNEHLVDRV